MQNGDLGSIIRNVNNFAATFLVKSAAVTDARTSVPEGGTNMNQTTKTITRTAVLLALLVVLQTVTKAAGQIVTGSCVN